MKISWGTGIVAAIVIFMIITIATVVFMMNQNVDLVSDNYYQKGIEYQHQIDNAKRSNELAEPVKIEFDGNSILLSFPILLKNQNIKGDIFFYRPSDSSKDFKVPISLTELSQLIPVKGLINGLWRVQVNWNLNDKEKFYNEASFILE